MNPGEKITSTLEPNFDKEFYRRQSTGFNNSISNSVDLIKRDLNLNIDLKQYQDIPQKFINKSLKMAREQGKRAASKDPISTPGTKRTRMTNDEVTAFSSDEMVSSHPENYNVTGKYADDLKELLGTNQAQPINEMTFDHLDFILRGNPCSKAQSFLQLCDDLVRHFLIRIILFLEEFCSLSSSFRVISIQLF